MENISLFKTHKEEAHLQKTFHFGGERWGRRQGKMKRRKRGSKSKKADRHTFF